MKVLVLGKDGQLGQSFLKIKDTKENKFLFSSRNDIDITDFELTYKKIKNIRPNVIINTTAYTAVDCAENEKDIAFMINHLSVKNIANLCKKMNILLVHVSTDYVFDGLKAFAYKEDDKTNPMSIYGASKRMGEIAIENSGCNYLIFRTSWLFSEFKNNFLKTVLKLANEKNKIKIVKDQIGCPTYAPDLAKAIVEVIEVVNKQDSKSIYHYAGHLACSWSDFANYIVKYAIDAGILKKNVKILPILSEEFHTLAKRPMNSQLDSSLFKNEYNLSSSNWIDGIKSSLYALKIK